uniref:Tetratricopeptide repeat domain 9B n=2 Tax=Cyprinodon variegatus TaxID=28743 RepID=A0A3Q2FG74_CYPVA
MELKIQKAIDFKTEGHRCYKEKKFREAIGKYHRALLQLKGVHVVDGTTSSEVSLLSQAAAKLTEEQRRAVESTEIECYDSLTGERWVLLTLQFTESWLISAQMEEKQPIVYFQE